MKLFKAKEKLHQIVLWLLAAMVLAGLFCCNGVGRAAAEERSPATEQSAPLAEEGSESESPVFSSSLEGYGTQEQPYRVSSVQDLVDFRNDVNNGNTYAGQYVVQTVDLALDLISNFDPIGKVGGGSYFMGVYNGQGHTISALTIKTRSNGDSRNLALFGTLVGTVMNLGIESGYISGEIAASFAVNAVGSEAALINCYSKAEIFGTIRAGGLVDDFAGDIYNCWYDATASASARVPLVSFYARNLYHCYATGEITPDSFAGAAVNCESVTAETLYSAAFAERLNEGVLTAAMNAYYPSTECAMWTYGARTEGDEDELFFQQAEWTFTGAGTAVNPYRIESVTDLLLLNVKVNLEGESFEGEYFAQTADLDLAEVYNFVPIGIYNSGRYFYGVYDGGGHIIENLVVNTVDRTPTGITASNNNGFFGMLGGIVRNLGFESGVVRGANCGSISSHAAPDSSRSALILNCYSKVRVYGTDRSGGIVDNFNGSIENCIYYNVVQTDVPLVSYSAIAVRHCYSTVGLVVPETFWGNMQESEVIYSYTHLDELCTTMNDYILEYARSYRQSNTAYAEWRLQTDGSMVFTGNFEKTDVGGIGGSIIEQFPDEVIVVKLVLCSAVVVVLSVVIDVIWKRRRAARQSAERREKDDR